MADYMTNDYMTIFEGGCWMPGKTIYHRMKTLNARMAANYRRGIGPTRVVLLLTTTGRKSGLPRVTPLQFEKVDETYYIASARGQEADWFKNIRANPNVHICVRKREFDATAEPVTDPARIADFIELRLRRHPIMIRLIMHVFDGVPLRFTRVDLERFCQEKAMVILHPRKEQSSGETNSEIAHAS
jgi:deazaflavin-dependent oxidoreductase (nitroreductase family)